jgi:hypothetical protein
MQSPTRLVIQPRWLRVSDACARSGIGITKLYELIRTGRVSSILLDGKRLIDAESVDNLADVAATPPTVGKVVMRRGGPGRRPKRSADRDAAPAPMAAGFWATYL